MVSSKETMNGASLCLKFKWIETGTVVKTEPGIGIKYMLGYAMI